MLFNGENKIIKRFKSNKTLVNGTMFSMFSFVNRGISFLLLIILARYIMPAEYGQLSLFNTIVEFLGYVVVLSSQGYFAVSYFQRKGLLFRQDTTSIILILLGSTCVLSAILLISQDAISKLANLPPLFLWLAIVISFSQVFVYLFLDYLRVQEKVVKYGIISCGFALVNFSLSIIFVVYKGFSWKGIIYSLLVTNIIFGLAGLFILLKKELLTRTVTWEGTKMILLWGIPLIPHSASVWIKQGLDRFIINDAYTIEEVGLFSFALTLTSIIIMIGTAFNSTNSVSIYKILSTELAASVKVEQLKKQSRNIGLIYTIGYILVLVGATVMIPLVLPNYRDSLPYFWIISVSGYLNCLYFLCVNYLFYFHRNKSIMTITITSSLIHLSLSLLLTKYSLYFTASIYILSQFMVLIMVMRKSFKTLQIELLSKC